MSRPAMQLVPAEHRAKKALPALSDALTKFLKGAKFPPWELSGGEGNSAELWGLHDIHAESGMASRIMQGYCLARLRALSERDFKAGLIERQIPLSSSYRRIEEYETFMVLGSLDQVRKLAHLGLRRTLALKDIREELPEFLDGGEVDGLTYDAARAMTAEELEDWRRSSADRSEGARKLLAENRELATKNRSLKQQRDDLQRRVDAPHNDLPLPHWCAHARQEAAAQAARIAMALDFAEGIQDQVLHAPRGTLEQHEWERAQHLAAGTLYQTLLPLQARIGVVLETLRRHFGPNVTGGLLPSHVPDKAEAKHYIQALHAALGADLTAAEDRYTRRRVALMEGPGNRPMTHEQKAARKGAQSK